MDLLKFEEAEPEALPDLVKVDDYGDPESFQPDPALWRRIEQYTAYRWTPRHAVWIVSGPGCWEPHLRPVSDVSVDIWDDNFTWTATTLPPLWVVS